MNKFIKLIFIGFVLSIFFIPLCLASENISEIITYPELKMYDSTQAAKFYNLLDYQEIVSISVNNIDTKNQKAELTLKLRNCVKNGEGCFVIPLVFPCIVK